jgi:stress response protein YsnF
MSGNHETKVGRVPIVEETAQLQKQQVAEKRVRISTKTEVVEELVRDNLLTEEIEIDRVPVNRAVEIAPKVRVEGDVTVVPVLEEVLVIDKRLVLKEELHIRRCARREDMTIPVSLRKQRVVVEDDSEPTPELKRGD